MQPTHCHSRCMSLIVSCSGSAWKITSAWPSATGTLSTGPAVTSLVREPFDRPWLTQSERPGRGQARRWTPPSSSSPSSEPRSSAFHDIDIAPAGTTFAETKRNLEEMVVLRRGTHGPDRASSSSGARATPSAIPDSRPAPRPTQTRRCLPTPPPRSRTPSTPPTGSAARTTSCGAAGKATRRCSTPECDRKPTSWPASSPWWSSTSTQSALREPS